MMERLDNKGKFYTEVISKNLVKVSLRTGVDLLSGNLHITPGQRLKDELDQQDQFIALTDGDLISENGEVIRSFDFIAVKKEQIIWVIEEESRDSDSTQGGKSWPK
jgi:hypothetical protein